MEIFKIDLRVGYGTPVDDDITFNFHFLRPEGVEWVTTYSYGQLCRLDNFICINCDKIKHVVFPVLSRHRIKATIKALIAEDFVVESVHFLHRLKGMIELWAHQTLMRLHATPRNVHDNVQKFYFLPNGPVADDPIIPGIIEQLPGRKKGHNSGVFGFGRKKDGAVDIEDDFDFIMQHEAEAEDSQPPLLRVNVRRGREGRRGKLEYEIQVYYSRNMSDEPWCVLRRYSEFAALYHALLGFESEKFLFTTFPLPPAKCSIGMSLDEAELSIRTRQLDAWFRDAFCQYLNMTSQSRAAMRVFLQLIAYSAEEADFGDPFSAASSSSASLAHGTAGEDMQQKSLVALSIQNRLSMGLVEGSRAVMYEFTENSPAVAKKTASQNQQTRRHSGTSSDHKEKDRDAGSDEGSALSGDSKHSSQISSMSLATKKKKKNMLNSMWESMSAISNGKGSKASGLSVDHDHSAAAAVVDATPKKRTTRFVVLNAIVSGENPFVKSALVGMGGALTSTPTGTLGVVAEGEESSQSMSMSMSMAADTAAIGFTVADSLNQLLAHQARIEGHAKAVPHFRHKDYNKELFKFVADGH